MEKPSFVLYRILVCVLFVALFMTSNQSILVSKANSVENVLKSYSAGVYESKNPNFLGMTLNYRLYVPKNYDSSKSYPLVLFLHGSGERGEDNESQILSTDRIPYILLNDEYVDQYPCIIVAPQASSYSVWAYQSRKKTTSYRMDDYDITANLSMVIDLVIETCNNYSVDKNRLYITGLSMGGLGTWDAIMRYPDMFAAAIPICGAGDPSKASWLKNLPIWVYHSSDDPTVSVSGSRDMVNALRAVNGNVKYTEYTDKGHAAWIPAYGSKELYAWMFGQSKLNKLPDTSSAISSSTSAVSSSSSAVSRASSTVSSSAVSSSQTTPVSSSRTASLPDYSSAEELPTVSSSEAYLSSNNNSDIISNSPPKGEPGNAFWIGLIVAFIIIVVVGGCFYFLKDKIGKHKS